MSIYQKKITNMSNVNKSKMTVAYACDDKYVFCALVSIKSLLEYNNKEDLDIHLISVNISKENLKIIKNVCSQITIHNLNSIESIVGEKYKDIEKRKPTYSKMFLDKIIGDKKRILWIDADTLICSSIEGLYNEDLKNCVCGMVEDCSYLLKKLNLFKDNETYYNAGVILIDTKKWRQADIFEKLCKQIKDRDGKSSDPDQSYLNCVLKGKIQTLDKKYNCLMQYTNEVKNPVIYHFAGNPNCRPWYKEYKFAKNIKEEWFNYLKQADKYCDFKEIDAPKKDKNKVSLIFRKMLYAIYYISPKIIKKKIIYIKYGYKI